ncbi:hypothetical protein BT63DRAFT_355764, partial [Microthyrium microscopicum]
TGGGPSSLILSYLLNGHVPYYTGDHPDDLLDSKLRRLPNLLHITPEIYSHFGSSIRYASQALAINALLDTLVRPNADTEINPPSCIDWRYRPEKAVSHIVLTESSNPGGQWTRASGSASDDIGTLSYSEMLSLPGYSFTEHYQRLYGKNPPELMRPSRTLVASYYAAYPNAVGITSSIKTSYPVSRVSRTTDGFIIEPHNIKCKHLVLATGTFTHSISPPPLLAPIQRASCLDLPLLVIGSGFSAADTIISSPPGRKIIHLFKWAPTDRPSPLRGCHNQAYPEYASVYRQMKAAAAKYTPSSAAVSPSMRRKSKSNPFFAHRDWASTYEGLPNATITSVTPLSTGGFQVNLTLSDGTSLSRIVGNLAYHVGQRGSLSYLDPKLLLEVTGRMKDVQVTGQTLRAKLESHGAQIAPAVFAIGSLTGDSLVRHAFGACVDAACAIMGPGTRVGSP